MMLHCRLAAALAARELDPIQAMGDAVLIRLARFDDLVCDPRATNIDVLRFRRHARESTNDYVENPFIASDLT